MAGQRTIRQFHVVPIGPVQFDADGQALRLDQEAALDPALAPVRGVGPEFFPPERSLVRRTVEGVPFQIQANHLVVLGDRKSVV